MKGLMALIFGVCILVSAVSASATEEDTALRAFAGHKGTVTLAGSPAHIPVMLDAATNITRAYPDVHIAYAGGGTGVGIRNVAEGLVDIGNSGRALREGELHKYGLVSWAFAVDGIAVVVHPANPVSALSWEQLRKIYSGEITNWKDVGGGNGRISLCVREEDSATREVFEEKGLNKVRVAPARQVVSSNGGMKDLVAQNKNAIGYVGIGMLDERVKAVTLGGMTPTQENARNGSYALSRLLYMNTKGQPQGLAQLFIEYIYSPAGAEIIRRAGYLPLGRR